MFHHLYHSPAVIKRHLDAPLLEERMRYLNYRAKQGISRKILFQIADYQLIIIKHLHIKKGETVTPEEIALAAKQYDKCRAIKDSRLGKSHSLFCKKRFIQHASHWLRFLDRIKVPAQPSMPSQITEFIDYMRNEKGLSERTIHNNLDFLIKSFSQGKKDLSQLLAHLTPEHLDNFLIQVTQKGTYARRTIQKFASTLRVFLRYAEGRGWCRPRIADSIHSPRNYTHQSLPSGPCWEDVQRLLKTTEGNNPVNIRDRAILLLLVVYGMRSGEVRKLQFEDIDWERQVLRLKRTKCGITQQFPLAQTVGRSLMRYIKRVRPQRSAHHEIFLTLRAPFRPLKIIYHIVANRMKPFNIAIEHHGSHSLRHACATRLINQGISLKAIADHLGHRNLETTRIYAKIDLSKLRDVASFNMGGLS